MLVIQSKRISILYIVITINIIVCIITPTPTSIELFTDVVRISDYIGYRERENFLFAFS
jgi:hypothetical protein